MKRRRGETGGKLSFTRRSTGGRMTDYEECPFCGRIFETVSFHGLVRQRPVEGHIRNDHKMVKVRKGSNYRWVPEAEVRSRLREDRKKS